MAFIAKFISSLFLFVSGLLLIKYKRNIHGWTGRFYWAEKYLGTGGTYVAISLFGLLLMFFAVGYLFGVFDKFSADAPPLLVPFGN